MPKFAANISLLFTELPFLDRFAAAAEAGFRAVECQFPYEVSPVSIAGALRQSGLSLVLFNLSPGIWANGDRGLAALASRQDEFRQSVPIAIAYARLCGTTQLHAMAGIADCSDSGATATYRDNLRYAAELLAPEGMSLLIEPINRRDMSGYFLSDFDVAIELIQAMELSNLRLQFDIYHRQMMCGDVIAGLRAAMPLIGHVQIAGVPGRHEPVNCELDYAAIFAELDRLGYRGFIGCEYKPRGSTLEGLGWLSPYLPQVA
jgi:hydroxypyruvate isomerase